MLESYSDKDWVKEASLELVGGCRDADDEARVAQLRTLAKELGILGRVNFHVNASQMLLIKLLRECRAGVHTMWNEHFGIGVVEMQAAGCIPVAHNSGGPKADIVRKIASAKGDDSDLDTFIPTGILAATPDEIADAMAALLAPNHGDDQVEIEIRAGE